MKYKIGQKIEFKKEFIIDTSKGTKVKVIKGDTAMVLRKVDDESGEIVYLTGDAKGLSHIVKIQIDDKIDVESLTKKIMEMMNE